MIETAAQPSLRAVRPAAGDNHHLWRNGRMWWIAFTVENAEDGRPRRRRFSLRTRDVVEARRRRDLVLRQHAASGVGLAIRLPRRRSA